MAIHETFEPCISLQVLSEIPRSLCSDARHFVRKRGITRLASTDSGEVKTLSTSATCAGFWAQPPVTVCWARYNTASGPSDLMAARTADHDDQHDQHPHTRTAPHLDDAPIGARLREPSAGLLIAGCLDRQIGYHSCGVESQIPHPRAHLGTTGRSCPFGYAIFRYATKRRACVAIKPVECATSKPPSTSIETRSML